MTIGELTQWTRLRHWGPHNIASLDAWLTDKPVLPAARSVAMRWGELSAAATQRGRPRPVNDSWVAACCLAYGLPLATLSTKDFADFAEPDGLVLVSGRPEQGPVTAATRIASSPDTTRSRLSSTTSAAPVSAARHVPWYCWLPQGSARSWREHANRTAHFA